LINDVLTFSHKNVPEAPVRGDQICRNRTEIEALVPAGARKVLDLGCGTGLLGKSLLSRGAKEVVGVDIDNSACEEARRNLTKVICGNIEEIELPLRRDRLIVLFLPIYWNILKTRCRF